MNLPELRRRAAAFIGTPLLAWLALPGRFSIWPLLLICLVPLFVGLGRMGSAKKAFACGLFCGIPFYLFQIYWIIPVLVHYGGLPWFLAVPALLLLVIYMGLYLGFFAGGFYLFERSNNIWLFLTGIPALWVGLDWLRSWLFSGFPWMDLGYGFWSVPSLLQAADLFGHYGYTFLILLINALFYLIIVQRFPRRQRQLGVLLAAVIILAGGIYNAVRWHQVKDLIAQTRTPVVGVVQGNIAQDMKWSPSEKQLTVKKYIDLSEQVIRDENPELVVWPETALPFYPRNNELAVPLVEFVKRNKVSLLTGAPWFEVETDENSRKVYFYNGALLMPASGRFEEFYFKSHLVPYGEYVPLKRYMPFLEPLVEAVGDFTPGRIEQPLVSGEIRAGVLICFESIFEDLGRKWVNTGANLLVNLTNDAWYGKSSAPYQSWAMSIYRSVETRRSLVRSANTGISGFIDPLGRIVKESGLFIEWSAAGAVPLLEEETIFVRGGYLFAPLCAVFAALIMLFLAKRSKRTGGSVL